jgi:hypothetical protein
MRRILVEDENDSPVAGMLKSVEAPPDSVDDIIDSLIIRYENESVKEESDEAEQMMEALRFRTLRFLLEAEEDAPPATEPAGSEDTKEKVPDVDPEKPPLDIDLFTKKIARLVLNSRNMIPMEEVIISRAQSFLSKNYGQNYAEEMQDILDQQYDFDLTGEEDVIDVPIAVGAAGKSGGA